MILSGSLDEITAREMTMTTTKDMADFCTPVANSTMFTARYVFYEENLQYFIYVYLVSKRRRTDEGEPALRKKLRKVGDGWSVVETPPNPLTMDGRSWRDVSLGDTLEEMLRPKMPPTRRERLNLPDDVPTPPPSPPSSPSPLPLRPAMRKSRRNLII